MALNEAQSCAAMVYDREDSVGYCFEMIDRCFEDVMS